jgi:hypothetical protein
MGSLYLGSKRIAQVEPPEGKLHGSLEVLPRNKEIYNTNPRSAQSRTAAVSSALLQ